MNKNDSDDLTKIEADKDFVNCNQKWELEKLLEQGYSLKSIKSCCRKDLGNNPRNRFKDCLEKFRDRPKFKL